MDSAETSGEKGYRFAGGVVFDYSAAIQRGDYEKIGEIQQYVTTGVLEHPQEIEDIYTSLAYFPDSTMRYLAALNSYQAYVTSGRLPEMRGVWSILLRDENSGVRSAALRSFTKYYLDWPKT